MWVTRYLIRYNALIATLSILKVAEYFEGPTASWQFQIGGRRLESDVIGRSGDTSSRQGARQDIGDLEESIFHL